MNLQHEDDYTSYYERVIDWNMYAGKTLDSASMSAQEALIKEELEELFEAFDTDNEEKFYDELADLFVVSAFYNAMQPLPHVSRSCTRDFVEPILGFMEDAPAHHIFGMVLEMMSSVKRHPDEYLLPVLESNDTKFFPASEREAQEEYAREKYARRYKGIYSELIPNTGMAVLKDSKGKILKPSSFKSCEEFKCQ